MTKILSKQIVRGIATVSLAIIMAVGGNVAGIRLEGITVRVHAAQAEQEPTISVDGNIMTRAEFLTWRTQRNIQWFRTVEGSILPAGVVFFELNEGNSFSLGEWHNETTINLIQLQGVVSEPSGNVEIATPVPVVTPSPAVSATQPQRSNYEIMRSLGASMVHSSQLRASNPQGLHPSQLPFWYPEAIEWMLSDEYVYLVRQEFYRLVNEHRVAQGVSSLEVNPSLEDYADLRSKELRVQFSHTRPDGSRAVGILSTTPRLVAVAENISGGGIFTSDPKEHAYSIFSGWRRSTRGHNENMISAFDSHITMALGFAPELVVSANGERYIASAGGNVFIAGYGEGILEN